MNLYVAVGFRGKMYSGKSTAAKYLIDNHGYTRVGFADPIREMMRALGVTDEQLSDPVQKEAPNPLLGGNSVRQLMQHIGQAGRAMDVDFYVKLWKLRVEELLRQGVAPRFVADDMRFENEADHIQNVGGYTVTIVGGPGLIKVDEKVKKHTTETQEFLTNVTILNDGTLAAFYHKVEYALS